MLVLTRNVNDVIDVVANGKTMQLKILYLSGKRVRIGIIDKERNFEIDPNRPNKVEANRPE